MHSYHRFIKDIFIIGLLNLTSLVQNLIFLPIITKILGAENYGIWSQLWITMSLIVPLTFLGLQASLTRFLPSGKNKKEIQEGVYSALILIFIVVLAISLILVIFSAQISQVLGFSRIFVKFLALTIIFEALNTIILVVIQSIREIGTYFWFVVAEMLGETALVVGSIILGYGLYGAVASYLLIRIIICLFLLIYIFLKIGVRLPDFSMIKSYLSFGLPTIFNSLSYWVVTASDRYFIGFFLGIIFVGYYVPAYSIGVVLNFFLFPLATILSIVLPKIFDERNIDEVKKYLSYSLKYFLLIAIPSVFGMSILSKKILTIFSTSQIALHSYFVTPFVVVSILLYGISYFFSQILVLEKKTKTIATIWIFSAIFNLGLNIIFIPKFGIIAAAISTLTSYLFSFSAICYFASKEFSFEIDWPFIFKSIFSSIVMSLFIIWFNPIGLSRTIIAIALSAGIYAILIFLSSGIKKKEFNFFKNLLIVPFANKSEI